MGKLIFNRLNRCRRLIKIEQDDFPATTEGDVFSRFVCGAMKVLRNCNGTKSVLDYDCIFLLLVLDFFFFISRFVFRLNETILCVALSKLENFLGTN